jgi:hypothetical protein
MRHLFQVPLHAHAHARFLPAHALARLNEIDFFRHLQPKQNLSLVT